VNNWEGNKKR